MTNSAAVEKQLQEDVDNFSNKAYDGKIDIPSNLMEVFKKGVMSLAPQYHKINCNKLHVISKKELNELSFGDLRDVVTIILNTPFDKIYSDFNEAMESHLRIQKFIICYNNCVDEFDKKLQARKAVLTDLTRNVNPNGNGLRLAN